MTRSRKLSVLCLGIVWVAVACSSGEKQTPTSSAPPEESQMETGLVGGETPETIEAARGNQLEVPAGALAEPEVLSLTVLGSTDVGNVSDPSGALENLNQACDILDLGPDGTTFEQGSLPTVTVFCPDGPPPGAELWTKASRDKGNWEKLDTALRCEGKFCSFEVAHFSLYQVTTNAIGSLGGSVVTSGASVTVPAGAYSSLVPVRISPAPPESPMAPSGVSFPCGGVVFDPEDPAPSADAQLSLSCPDLGGSCSVYQLQGVTWTEVANATCEDGTSTFGAAALGTFAIGVSDRGDNGCDGLADAANPDCAIHVDNDGDGFCEVAPCADNTSPGDCNDADLRVHPNAVEVCNGRDDDCDGTADEDISATLYYNDADGDGYGDPHSAQRSCAPPQDMQNPTEQPGALVRGCVDRCGGDYPVKVGSIVPTARDLVLRAWDANCKGAFADRTAQRIELCAPAGAAPAMRLCQSCGGDYKHYVGGLEDEKSAIGFTADAYGQGCSGEVENNLSLRRFELCAREPDRVRLCSARCGNGFEDLGALWNLDDDSTYDDGYGEDCAGLIKYSDYDPVMRLCTRQ